MFGDRLKNARKIKGMSLDELCLACNRIVSKQSLSKYENGLMEPSSTVLIALCEALNVSPDYFFKSQKVALGKIEFRVRKSFPKKKLESIKEYVRYKVERYIEIENILGIKQLYLKKIAVKNKEDVILAAEKTRSNWKLGEDAIVNVISTLEENGIKVIESGEYDGFDGMSCIVDEMPVIVFKYSGYTERDRFTLLHELGHLILDFDSSFEEKEREKLCHLFASEMLIPKSVFIRILGQSRHNILIDELKNIQKEFGIAIEALMYKAKDCKIINENLYQSFFIRRNQACIKESSMQKEIPNRFEFLVIRGFSNGVISSSKAAELLDCSISELKSKDHFCDASFGLRENI